MWILARTITGNSSIRRVSRDLLICYAELSENEYCLSGFLVV